MVEVDREQVELLAEIVQTVGVSEACRQSGLGRAAVLGIVARGACMKAQAALLREFFARRRTAA